MSKTLSATRKFSCIVAYCLIWFWSPMASAQTKVTPNVTPESLKGNWYANYSGFPEEGQTLRTAVTISQETERVCEKQSDGRCLWRRTPRDGSGFSMEGFMGDGWSQRINKRSVPPVGDEDTDTTARITFFQNGAYHSAKVKLHGFDGDRVGGSWKQEDREGAAQWEFARPKIREVRISDIGAPAEEARKHNPAASDIETNGTYDDHFWTEQAPLPANRPAFYIELYGDNMWGLHEVTAGDSIELEAFSISPIRKDGAAGPDATIGQRIKVLVWNNATSGKKKLKFDDQEITFTLNIQNLPALAGTTYTLPALPSNGEIQERGGAEDIEGLDPDELADCSCKKISLARVEVKTFKGHTGGVLGWMGLTDRKQIYSVNRVFNRTTIPANRSEAEKVSFSMPKVSYPDQVCFFFSFPEALAYMDRDGKRSNLCPADVRLTYPYSRSETGERQDEFRLFSTRGMSYMQIGTRNVICRAVSDQVATIGPGKGAVNWQVNGEDCGSVSFEVN